MTKIIEIMPSILNALYETLFMAGISLIFAIIIGLIIGIIMYCTQKDGLFEALIVYKIMNFLVNVLRAVPFIILLFLIIPFTLMLVGTMLGPKAAIPSLILSAAPFYARMTMISLSEVDKGTLEASKAMGASKLQIICKVLLPESLPALVSSISVTAINLVGYTAMAGAIGSGGLGNQAYMYGFARRNNTVLITATLLIVLIVFIIQAVGDYAIKKLDKR